MKLSFKNISNQKRVIYVFLFVLVIGGFIWFCLKFSQIANFFFGDSQKYKGELITLFMTSIGGLVLFYGLYLNARRTKAIEKQNKLTRKGQVDEQFKNAIEHLGDSNQSIILGGIYTLHNIAIKNKAYRKTVFDILCSYLRENTYSIKNWDAIPSLEENTIKPTIVVQTILDLIFKSNGKEFIYEGIQANISGVKCYNANMEEALLKGALLVDVHFEGTNFLNAHFEETFIDNAHFEDAELAGVHFEDAKIYNSHFENAGLHGANFKRAKLQSPIFTGASLTYSHFESAQLWGFSHFEGAYINLAYFEGASLLGICFAGAVIKDSHFEGAYLRQIYFEGSDLTNSHFEGANLKEVFFNGAILSGTHFEGVFCEEVDKLTLTERILTRVKCNTSLDYVFLGMLGSTRSLNLIDNFKEKIHLRIGNLKFEERIKEANIRDTKISDAITGILTNEMAERIIERYNKAME